MTEHLFSSSPRKLPNATDSAGIEIAGIRIAVSCSDPGMKLSAGEMAQKFRVDKPDAHINIRVFWGSPSVAANSKKIFDSGSLWQLYFNGENYQFRFVSPIFGNLPYKVASFSPDFSSGEVFLRQDCICDQQIDPLEYPLDELLVINLLAQGRGVELHAAGFIDPEGNGHLFVGQSGAGKTTITRLWQDQDSVRILSDDRIILRNEAGRFWMHGTPWHGEGRWASPTRAPLARVCFLRHAVRNAFVPQGHAEAAARLLACSFPPFYSAEGIRFTMKFLHGVVDAVPCYELGFLPNETVVEFIRKNAAG